MADSPQQEPFMPTVAPNITALVQDFVSQDMAAAEAAAAARAQAAVAAALGSPAKRGPGSRKRLVASAAAPAKPVRRRKAPKVTAKLIRARRLQGQYLGALKSLRAAAKARVKAVARDKGVPEALKVAASLKPKN